jgi:hypothetical protein
VESWFLERSLYIVVAAGCSLSFVRLGYGLYADTGIESLWILIGRGCLWSIMDMVMALATDTDTNMDMHMAQLRILYVATGYARTGGNLLYRQ